jgi:glycosyltransferase involved in cell wall biosynthesis
MNLSLILTINNRPPQVSKRVADSLRLPGNTPDELIIVLDRPTEEARQGAIDAYTDLDCSVRFLELSGEPGWKGPARAWNHGFNNATGDLLYTISSEVVQDSHNLDKAKELCQNKNIALFGACHDTVKDPLVVGVEPGLLVCAEMPRPLGFIACFPKDKALEIKGYDETFMKGFWYDDDDFFLRLWHSPLDFLFRDDIHGTHINHARPDLETPEGMQKTEINRAYMTRKHGKCHPWPSLPKLEKRQPGITKWTHT